MDNKPEKWNLRILKILNLIDVDSYVIGESYYTPFFNKKFGPDTTSVETEVVVLGKGRSKTILEKLISYEPRIRWHVTEIEENTKEGLVNFLKCQSLICLCGAVRFNNESLEYVFANDETNEHLQLGRIEINKESRSNTAEQDALQIIQRYPGLKSHFLNYRGFDISDDWDELEEKIKGLEKGGRKNTYIYNDEQKELVNELLNWHSNSNSINHTVPIPYKSNLPQGNPWDATDEEFREWLIDQTLTKYPRTEKDPYLKLLLNIQKGGEQKPTHQGWEVSQHAIMAALQLNTDGLLIEDRKLIRLATLWHDVGKAKNVWTPGAHGGIGSKFWLKYKPDWIKTEEQENMVSFLIRTHDYLGLMDRGIKDNNYKGGLTPLFIKNYFKKCFEDLEYTVLINKKIYEADISSVSTLRWLLPLTPILEKMILCYIQEDIVEEVEVSI